MGEVRIFLPFSVRYSRQEISLISLMPAPNPSSWGGMEGFCKDAEDIVTLKIPHHLVTLPRPYMISFHYQLQIHYIPKSLFLQVILIEEDQKPVKGKLNLLNLS